MNVAYVMEAVFQMVIVIAVGAYLIVQVIAEEQLLLMNVENVMEMDCHVPM